MDRPLGQPGVAKTSSRPAPRGTASYQRRRAVTACQVCRSRRTKCDNLKPSCSFCLKVGATCIQAPADFSGFDPASIQILERLDVLERLMRGGATAAAGTEQQHRPSPAPAEENAGPSSHSGGLFETPEPVATSMVQAWTLDGIMAWPCFRDLFTPDEQTEDFLFPSSPESCLVDAQSPGMATLAATDLEPHCVRDLVGSFFSYVHVKNPILDEQTTRSMVDSVTLNGIDWSPQSCLSLLICALGAIATPFGPSDRTAAGTIAHAKAHSYFRAAERRIGTLITSYDIIAPQCLFLAGVFMMCNFEVVRAWRFFIQALAQCQHLKLHSPKAQRRYLLGQGLDQDMGQDDPDMEREFDSLHQAMYWTAWKSEREMRILLGLTDFGAHDDRDKIYPAFFPTPPAPRQDTSENQQTAWYFYLAEISLRRLSGRLKAEFEAFGEEHASSRESFLQAAAAVVPSYEAQLREWAESLPQCLSLGAPAEEDDVCRFVLRGQAVGLGERLYWPFLTAFLHGDEGAVLGSAWLAPFAGLAQKGLDQQKLQIEINRPGFRHRHHGTWALVQQCSRSALVLSAAAVQSGVASRGGVPFLRMPFEWESDVRDVVGLLDSWGEETRTFDGTRSVLSRAFSRVPPSHEALSIR